MSNDQSILERLLSLEDKTKEIEHLRDNIYVLQKENFDFKTEIFKLRKENGSLKEKIEGMENKMANLGQNNPIWKTTPTHESKTDKTDNLERRVTALEGNTRMLTKSNKDFTKKVKNVQSAVSHVSRLQTVINRVMVKKENEPDVSKKVDDLCTRTDAMENRQRNTSQSITSVRLNTSGDLSTGRSVKLDKCHEVYVDRGVFDRTSCCLVPQCDGDYGIGVLLVQVNDGVIEMRLDWDGSGGFGSHIGHTERDGDKSFGLECFSLKKGQRVWLKAVRCKGEAIIWRCQVLFWLLG